MVRMKPDTPLRWRDLWSRAIVVNLEPCRLVARNPLAPVRIAKHRVTRRPAATIRVT
jgi:hypothetical protein